MLTSEELYNKVERLRVEKGLTVAKFNERAGISHGTLRSWKLRGTYPKIDVLEGLAVALEIPLPELLYDVDFMNLPPDEVELLSYWRNITAEQKRAILTTVKSMCK